MDAKTKTKKKKEDMLNKGEIGLTKCFKYFKDVKIKTKKE